MSSWPPDKEKKERLQKKIVHVKSKVNSSFQLIHESTSRGVCPLSPLPGKSKLFESGPGSN